MRRDTPYDLVMGVPEFMQLRDFGSRSITKYLMDYEKSRITIRRHPASLMMPIAVAFGTLVAVGALNAWVGGAAVYLWWIWLGVLAWVGWRFIAWSMLYFIITEYRVILVSGVLNRRVAMMPLGKISDINLDRSLLGRMLGFGTIVLESTGQEQALRNVIYMPYPEQLYLDISATIFPSRDESPDY
jgi:membrane protein YdbS with pleckstrin-like domain